MLTSIVASHSHINYLLSGYVTGWYLMGGINVFMK